MLPCRNWTRHEHDTLASSLLMQLPPSVGLGRRHGRRAWTWTAGVSERARTCTRARESVSESVSESVTESESERRRRRRFY